MLPTRQITQHSSIDVIFKITIKKNMINYRYNMRFHETRLLYWHYLSTSPKVIIWTIFHKYIYFYNFGPTKSVCVRIFLGVLKGSKSRICFLTFSCPLRTSSVVSTLARMPSFTTPSQYFLGFSVLLVSKCTGNLTDVPFFVIFFLSIPTNVWGGILF